MNGKSLFVPAHLVPMVRTAIEARAAEFGKSQIGLTYTSREWQRTAAELRTLAGKLNEARRVK